MVSRLYDENIEQDPRVRGLLDAAAAPTECGPLPGEREALAAFRSVHSRRRNSMSIPLTRVRVAVAAGLGAGVLLAAGAGAAAAGVLPGAAQDTARTVLDRVGVEVPGADEHSAGHADQRGHSTEVGSEDATAPTSGDKSAPRGQGAHEAHGAQGAGDKPAVDKDLPEASEHGQTVSSTARETDAEGADKGAEVSAVASDGRARSGGNADHPTAGQPDDHPTAGQPDDPGAAGHARADAAGSAGKAKAAEASDGRQGAGPGHP